MIDDPRSNNDDETERVGDVTETPEGAYPMPPEARAVRAASAHRMAPGTVIDGKYRVDGFLGEGGMGSVLRATQLALRRPVAIKVMRRDKSLASNALDRFRREAIALARLKHPQIVTIHDITDSPDVGTYIVMELVEGESLQTVISNQGRLDPSRAVAIIRQACDAIEAAHRAGVLHRDIKPANIVLETVGEREIAKVLDFGIADLRGDESVSTLLPEGIVGTPHYMAPEQAEGLTADARTDVYALGCTLYAMVVGAPPFADSAGGVTDVLFCQRNVVPVRPADRVPGMLPALESAILKALAKRPDDRFQSAAAFSEALASLATPTNLPRPITAFVGRDAVFAGTVATVETARLVTLFGPGGIGKTRLAIEVASRLGERFPDGVWMAQLESVRDAAMVPLEVARSAGVRERSDHHPISWLREALANRRVLLIVDNCEHVLEAVANLALELLESTPGVHMLVTSREALGVRGESVVAVPVLEVPVATDQMQLDDLGRIESVRLFVERARQCRPDFQLTTENRGTVVDLCRSLDGLPLAIELAAARVRSLNTRQILDRLSDRFRLLGSAKGSGRQSTLEAAIDWSYELLTPDERALFRRVSVFEGGWTLDAAEALASAAGMSAWDVLDLLDRLVDKSLVIVESRGEASRYGMLESIRQYGRRQLDAALESERWLAWHGDWATGLAQRAELALLGPESRVWLDRLEADHDNMRAALGRFREAGANAELLRLATSLGVFWRVHGYFSEGRAWLGDALERARELADAPRARALNALGVLAYYQGDIREARTHLEASVALHRTADDRASLGRMLFNLGAITNGLGEYERATELYRKSLEIFEATELPTGVARAINGLGLVAMDCGRNEDSRRLFERSIEVSREARDLRSVAGTLLNLGTVARRSGDCDRAERLTEESLQLARDLDDRQLIANAVHGLACVFLDRGDANRARARFRDAMTMSEQLDAADGVAQGLEGLAGVALLGGEPARALQLLGAAEAVRDAKGIVVHPTERAEIDRLRSIATGQSGEAAASAAIDAGRRLAPDAARDLALARGTGALEALPPADAG